MKGTGMFKSVVKAMLVGYKRWVSPMLPMSCRYTPTCSEYALEAVERHGVVKGVGLGLARILRCHPFVHGGFDPVPMPAACESHKRTV